MPNESLISSNPACRILLVEPAVNRPVSFAEKLSAHGIVPVKVLTSTRAILAAIDQSKPEVLILSVDVLDDATLQSLILIKQNAPLAVVIFAKQHAPKAAKAIIDAGVSSYIVDDVDAKRVPIIIDLARARFVREHAIYLELNQAKAKLFERKVIEKAKGIIMLQKKLSEDEAYAELRRSAMNQGRPMADLAQRVISVFDQRA